MNNTRLKLEPTITNENSILNSLTFNYNLYISMFLWRFDIFIFSLNLNLFMFSLRCYLIFVVKYQIIYLQLNLFDKVVMLQI